MAILNIGPLPGKEADIGKFQDWRYRRSWLVTTDNRFYYEGQVLVEGIGANVFPIPYYSTHPNDIRFVCKRLSARQERNSPQHWIVNADYDTAPWDNDDKQNPLDRRAKISWGSIKYQKAVEKTAAASPKAVVASNGLPFNPPPLKDTSRLSCTVKKNMLVVPSSLLTLPDKVNSGTFTIDGISVEQNVAKVMGINISDLKREGEIEYREFSYSLEFDPVDKWKGKYLNQGILQKSGSDRIPCVDKHGQPVRSPVPLDANGAQISDPTTNNATYTDYQIYEQIDFNGNLPLS